MNVLTAYNRSCSLVKLAETLPRHLTMRLIVF